LEGSGHFEVYEREMRQLMLKEQGSLADLQTGYDWSRIRVGGGLF
jgi:hypothetical protein